MKKKWICLMMALSLLMTMLVTGCGKTENSSASIDKFVGEWSCEESYLEDPDTYTGFYALDVDKSGEFSLYDAEAGNPGIAVTMTVDSDKEVTLSCQEEDFDPPAGWMDMSQKQTIQYEFASDQELHLSYTGEDGTYTLVFHLQEEEE